MHAPLTIFEHWHEYYLLIGTAAAALVALLFVAVSIGTGVLTPERASGTRLYMSPVVVHFTAVLFTCAVCLVPSLTPLSFAVIVGTSAIGATIYTLMILLRVIKDHVHSVDHTDRICYGAAPFVAYLGSVGAAALALFGVGGAPELLASSLMLLLVVNIRNAWDLAVFIVRAKRGLD